MLRAVSLAMLFHAVASAKVAVAVPEPSALPDLIICLVAVGCLAWYQHRKSNRRNINEVDHI